MTAFERATPRKGRPANKLTKLRRACLTFAVENGPVNAWPYSVCDMTTVRWCERQGYLAKLPARPFDLIPYAITDAGRSVLAAARGEGK